MTKCPYCGRKLIEEERYCFFCEQEIKKVKKEVKKKEQNKQKPIVAYCVKCKAKVNVNNPKYYVMKNKRISIKGNCPTCSTKVFRIVGMKKR